MVRQEPHRLPKTLSRQHSKQFSATGTALRSSSASVTSSMRGTLERKSRRGADLQEPLLEEGELQRVEEQEDYIDPGLVGFWMDVSVDRDYYSEVFSIAQVNGKKYLREVGHNGNVYCAMFEPIKDKWEDWLIATSTARSLRMRADESEKTDAFKLEFEFKSREADDWTESKAGRVVGKVVGKVGVENGEPHLEAVRDRQIALLIVCALALMDFFLFQIAPSRLRYRFYDADGLKWHPVQTSTGECLMPPPQPFYLEAGGAMVRTLALSTLLSAQSVTSWADEYPRKDNRLDWVKAYGLRWYLNYQTFSLPLSLVLVWYHWREAASKDFVCLGAMFVNAPYILNAMVSCAQYAIQRQYVYHMKAWARGAKHKQQRWEVGKGGFMEAKQYWLWILSLTSAVLVGTPTLVVFLVYCLQGLLQPVLLLQFVLILSSGATISWFLGAVKFWKLVTKEAVTGELMKRKQFLSLRWEVVAGRSDYSTKEQLAEAQRVTSELAELTTKTEEEARFGWTYAVFYFMPIFVSIRVALEVLFCEITYMHAGLSAWEATEVTWSERQICIFVVSIGLSSQLIIWRSWSFFQLFLEWL